MIGGLECSTGLTDERCAQQRTPQTKQKPSQTELGQTRPKKKSTRVYYQTNVLYYR
jgi:hypothetical protein